jgi:DNA-binding NtrC family response regulator
VVDNLPSAKKNGIIHLIDDDSDIVRIATKALQNSGYSVHGFSSTEEALEDIERQCRQSVSLLITDIRMAGHSGIEVAKRTRAIVREVPVIFLTGFEMHESEFAKIFPTLEGQNVFLQKPVSIDKLTQTVKELTG